MTSTRKPPLELKRVSMAIDRVEADGTFSGYASVFGHVDLGKDRVAPNAFSESLRQRGTAGVRMLFQHDPSEPIGKWLRISEDDHGLFAKGQIVAGSARGREVLELLREGAIDGLSIGFRTVRSRTDAKSGIRTILQADLWEISIVTFPMLPAARVSQVKMVEPSPRKKQLPSIREFERWLVRDAGLSRREAKTVIGSGFASLQRKRDVAPHQHKQLADRIRQAARQLSS